MKRLFAVVFLFLICAAPALAQSELEKIIATEKSFVGLTEEKGAKEAFLAYLAPDGVIFTPNPTNGRDFWQLQKDVPAILYRNPTYADISSNNMLAYTTGDWEFRANGGSDAPAAFGQYVTIWEKQKDGSFKIALDIGVTHEKPEKRRVDFTIPDDKKDLNARKHSPFNATSHFYRQAIAQGLRRSYRKYMADDVLFLRQDTPPIYGREASLEAVKNFKFAIDFPKTIAFVGSANLAYMSQTYQFTRDGRVYETGNMLQIWKFRNKEWQIVVDLLLPAPDENLLRN